MWLAGNAIVSLDRRPTKPDVPWGASEAPLEKIIIILDFA